MACNHFKYHSSRISCHVGIWNTCLIWNNIGIPAKELQIYTMIYIHYTVSFVELYHLWNNLSLSLVKIKISNYKIHDCQSGLLHWLSSRKKSVTHKKHGQERIVSYFSWSRDLYFYLFSQSLNLSIRIYSNVIIWKLCNYHIYNSH